MKRSWLCAVVFIFITGLALSCKKDKGDSGLSNLRIASVEVASSSSDVKHRMVYDAANNIDSIISTGVGNSTGQFGYYKFVYYTASYTITDESNLSILVTTNPNNMVSRLIIADSPSMVYKNNQLTEIDYQSPIATYPYIKKWYTLYTWTNGDMTSTNTGITYDYDLSKPAQVSDALHIDQLLQYGRSYYKTAHLPTTMSSNGVWAEKYIYAFDGNGRISQMKKAVNTGSTTVSDTIVYTYQYY